MPTKTETSPTPTKKVSIWRRSNLAGVIVLLISSALTWFSNYHYTALHINYYGAPVALWPTVLAVSTVATILSFLITVGGSLAMADERRDNDNAIRLIIVSLMFMVVSLFMWADTGDLAEYVRSWPERVTSAQFQTAITGTLLALAIFCLFYRFPEVAQSKGAPAPEPASIDLESMPIDPGEEVTEESTSDAEANSTVDLADEAPVAPSHDEPAHLS